MYTIFKNDTSIILTDDLKKFSEKKPILWKELNKRTFVEDITTAIENKIVFYHPDLDTMWNEFKAAFKVIEAAGGIVQNELKQILFIYRHDKWDLPKGKIEKGETLQNAAMREVKEECGFRNLDLNRQVSTTFHIYEEKGKQVLKISYWFLMFSRDQDLTPQIEEGITQVQWMDQANMAKIFKNTYPNIELLLSEYAADGQ